jgi:hypothetical protein
MLKIIPYQSNLFMMHLFVIHLRLLARAITFVVQGDQDPDEMQSRHGHRLHRALKIVTCAA